MICICVYRIYIYIYRERERETCMYTIIIYYYIILYYIMLYYVILCYIVLNYSILYNIISYYTISYYIILVGPRSACALQRQYPVGYQSVKICQILSASVRLAYLLPRSVRMHSCRSDPISADPICPQPRSANTSTYL